MNSRPSSVRTLVDRALQRALHSAPGVLVSRIAYSIFRHGFFSKRTDLLFRGDLVRLSARVRGFRGSPRPAFTHLHIGCGDRCVPGFLNVDARAGDEQVDLAAGNLPWDNGVFDVIVGQHVIEHFDLVSELIPLLRELRRVSKDGAEIWLSCPDMEKVCRSYVNGTLGQLIADREKRLGDLDLGQAPDQHMVNFLFHQWGEHRNLFDFGLLKWALEQTGFGSCTRTSEKQFLGRFPSFPPRKDDLQSLYVHATAGIAEGMKPR